MGLLRRYSREPLWGLLVELAHSLPSFSLHKAYVLDKILPRNPFISPKELSSLLNIPEGEALVILYEIRMTREEALEELRENKPQPRFSKAATGGTFNEIHLGHQILLHTAFSVSREVIIGVTSDEFVKKLGKEHDIKPYRERVGGLESFLKERGYLGRGRIVELNDPYGPVIHEEDIEAIVASQFTAGRGEEINRIRAEKGLPPLEIITCPIVLAEDGKPISSTRIARGEITWDGRVLR